MSVVSEHASPPGQESGEPKHHNGGLLLIGGFKLVEAVFFLCLGFGAFHYIHSNLSDAALRLATRLRMDPEGRLVSFMLDHLDEMTAHRLRQIGVATLLYAGLRSAEGVGLVMEKAWAEYLTVGVTAAFLPWEMFEIARHPDLIRIGLWIVNIIVLAYLVWWLRRKKRERMVVGRVVNALSRSKPISDEAGNGLSKRGGGARLR